MPSPFPGMNPYLEQRTVWQDFHCTFIPALRDALSPQVDPAFVVKIEENLTIHEPSAEARLRLGKADVAVSQAIFDVTHRKPTQGIATLDAPRRAVVSTDFEVEKQLSLTVRDRQNWEVVAAIEVLSPSNKYPGIDREQYLAKRRGFFRSAATFVEIDLLRGGPKMPTEMAPESDYCAIVSRHEERPTVGYWPIMLRDRLPRIPVPLREPVPVAWIDLQDTLNSVYDRAYYKSFIYRGTPEPLLTGDDLEWSEGILKSAGINIS